MFLECNHLTKDNIMGWVFQNLTERTKGSKNIPRKGNVLRKQNKVSRGKVESLKNIFFLSFLFSFKRFLQTWIKFIGLYIFYYYLVFFVSFIMFYEMCFTGLVYFSGTWMFIYYFCVNNTTAKIQQHQNWGKGLGGTS